MYVNVDLFEQAGVKVPYDGWTWSEFEAACRKITALSDAAGVRRAEDLRRVLPALAGHRCGNMVWTFGGEFFGDGGGISATSSLDEPPAQAALEFIQPRAPRRKDRLQPDRRHRTTAGRNSSPATSAASARSGAGWSPRYKSDHQLPVGRRPRAVQARRRTRPSMIYYTAWTMSAKTQAPGGVLQADEVSVRRRGGDRAVAPGAGDPAAEERRVLEGFSRAARAAEASTRKVFLDAIEYSRIAADPARAGVGRSWSTSKIDNSIKLGAVRHAEQREGDRARCGWTS